MNMFVFLLAVRAASDSWTKTRNPTLRRSEVAKMSKLRELKEIKSPIGSNRPVFNMHDVLRGFTFLLRETLVITCTLNEEKLTLMSIYEHDGGTNPTQCLWVTMRPDQNPIKHDQPRRKPGSVRDLVCLFLPTSGC